MKRCGFEFYKSRRKPFLTSAKKRQRVVWAKFHLSWTSLHWQRVLWTDKSIFQVSYGNVGRKVIRKKYETNDPSCYNRMVSHPALSWYGVA